MKLSTMTIGETVVVGSEQDEIHEYVDDTNEGTKRMSDKIENELGDKKGSPKHTRRMQNRTEDNEDRADEDLGKGWFDKMSEEKKKEYLQHHPHSKFA